VCGFLVEIFARVASIVSEANVDARAEKGPSDIVNLAGVAVVDAQQNE
jgi:hypothetical protein